MTKTKYGKIPNCFIDEYKDRLIGRVFKILPMVEEKSDTWDVYIESLLFELHGMDVLIQELNCNSDFLILLATLEELKKEHEHSVVKREVFKCVDLVKKL